MNTDVCRTPSSEKLSLNHERHLLTVYVTYGRIQSWKLELLDTTLPRSHNDISLKLIRYRTF